MMSENQKDDSSDATREWWRWWNSKVETNAFLLRALLAVDPDNPEIERVVKDLIDGRTNGTHWKSTRDSALAVWP